MTKAGFTAPTRGRRYSDSTKGNERIFRIKEEQLENKEIIKK